MSVNMFMLIIFVIYIVVMVLIGLVVYCFINNFFDYIFGGCSFGSFVMVLFVGVFDMSGWLLMGLFGVVYLLGLFESWIVIGLIVGVYFNWLFVVGCLWVQIEYNGNVLILFDYFINCFEDNSCLLWIFLVLVILVFFIIYCVFGIVVGVCLFESIFGFFYEIVLWVGVVVIIVYIFIGGFFVVSWIDIVQVLLMIFVLIFILVIVMFVIGGVELIFIVIELKDVISFDMFKGVFFIGVILLMVWGLGYFGQLYILVCFMVVDLVKLILVVCCIFMIWMIFCFGGVVVVGFFGIVYFQVYLEQVGVVSENFEWVFIELVKILFNLWIVGVLLFVIFVVVMSILSCQLLVCFLVFIEDFYKVFLCKGVSQLELVWVGCVMVLLVVVIVIWLVFNLENCVFGLVFYVWVGFGVVFGLLVLFFLLWKWMICNGVLVGMIVGVVMVILWKNLLGWIGLYEIIFGFFFVSVVIVVFSLFGKVFLMSMFKCFDDVEQEYCEVYQGFVVLVIQC